MWSDYFFVDTVALAAVVAFAIAVAGAADVAVADIYKNIISCRITIIVPIQMVYVAASAIDH